MPERPPDSTGAKKARVPAAVLGAWAAVIVIGYGISLTQPAGGMGVLVLPLVIAVFLLMAVPAFRLWRGSRPGTAAFGAGALLLVVGLVGGWFVGEALVARGTQPSALEIALVLALVVSGGFVLYSLRRLAEAGEPKTR